MHRQSAKSGIILPRNSMVDPYSPQKLPRIYQTLLPYCVLFNDFRQRTGNYALDLSGNNKNGELLPYATGSNTAVSQMWENAEPGGVNLDGINDIINWGTLPSIFDNVVTVASFFIWVRLASIDVMNILLAKYSNVTARRDLAFYFNTLASTGQLRVYLGTNSSSHYAYFTTDSGHVSADTSFHLGCAIDLSTNPRTCAIYVNGFPVAKTLVSAGTPPITFRDYGYGLNVPFANRLENSTAGSYNLFNGNFHSVLVLKNKFVSSEEALALYSAERSFMQC